MSDQTDTVERTEVEAAVLAAQLRIIDAAVREARRAGWCEEFERIMQGLFPDGPPDGSKEFVDSDGWSCRNIDRDGFDRRGWGRDGYNREGFDLNGRDRDGYNREGFDRDGFDRDGYNRQGVDRYGWSRDGWNADHTINRDSDEYRARFKYDRNGFPAPVWGYHPTRGVNVNGYTPEQQAVNDRRTYRFDTDGYDVNGLDHYGRRR